MGNQRAHHYKWGKRLPKPDYVDLPQQEWDKLTTKQRYELRYPEKNKNYRTDAHERGNLKKFGITPKEYWEMYESQNGLCAICFREETGTRNGVIKRLSVDHNHKTGQIRGLLCTKCNSAIGYLQDDPEIVESAAKYLRWYL